MVRGRTVVIVVGATSSESFLAYSTSVFGVQMRVPGSGESAGSSCLYLMTSVCACTALIVFIHLQQACIVSSATKSRTTSSEAHTSLR